MTPSFWQIAIVLVLVVLLFGRGKISELMGDVARGIKSFKKGMAEPEEETVAAARKDGIETKAEAVAGNDEAAKS
jgi:sec-independent protein translocase protein TatA